MLIVVCLASCGGAQRGASTELTPLGQARAVEILEASVASREEYGSVTHNIGARLGNGTRVNVDVLVRSLGAGFVYLNEQDRADLTGPIPEPADESQIYALLANVLSDDQQIHVMIVQDTDFEYLPNPRANERIPEDRTIDDVEARLRRDALDFLHAIYDLHGGQRK
jgi:hypothetical protein